MQPERLDLSDRADWAGAEARARGHAAAQQVEDVQDAPPAVGGVSGAALLEELAQFVRRFVVLDVAQAEAVALWVAHTYVLDAAESTPYLNITGPERRVGKSRLLEVLALLVREPLETANISEAALFRVVHEKTPTLLFDEIDSVFGGRAKEKEDLRGLLNAGHRRGAVAYRMVGDGANMRPQAFDVFCAKAFAGIGDKLPDTLADRSIRIGLKRKTRAEPVERLRRRDAAHLAAPVKDALAEWAAARADALALARPDLPDELDDRAQDGWEILLAIADDAGGRWPALARRAAVSLSGTTDEPDDVRVFLLAACRDAFSQPGYEERVATEDLLRHVATADESPFADWWNEKDVKPERGASQRLARLLRPYGVRSQQLRFGERNRRGFERGQFEEVFARYSPEPATPATDGAGSGETARYAPRYPTRYVPHQAAERVAGVVSSNERAAAGVAASEQGAENGRFPLIGDDDFLDFVAGRFRDDHVTTGEALELERLHRLVTLSNHRAHKEG